MFTTKRADGRSEALILMDYITRRMDRGELRPGDIIAHSELEAELGKKRGPSYYQAVTVATRKLEKSRHRSLQAVRGAGYKLIAGRPMLDKSVGYQDKAEHSVKTGLAVVRSAVAGDELLPAERVTATDMMKGMSFLARVLGQVAEETAQHTEAIQRLEKQQKQNTLSREVTEDELSMIKARLAAIEARQG